jgi:hypothetical protein
MAAPRPNRISKQNTNVPLVQLIQEYEQKRIIIPPHQREFRWDLPRQEKFIQSILKGYPIPSILMSSRRVDHFPTLEDGRQRITTASRYRSNQFPVKGFDGQLRKYSELSEIDRERFDSENVIIMTFSNANDNDRIEIFDWHQNGMPLTPGERYHAQHATPLVRFVKEQLMTHGTGYHDRAAAIWGIRGDPANPPEGFISSDKGRKWLLSATALVLGLSFGPANATKKYIPANGFMTADFPLSKQRDIKKDLDRIFDIYETVEARLPSSRPTQWINAYWDFGNFTGYILYSLSFLSRENHASLSLDEPIDFEAEDTSKESAYQPNTLDDEPEEWERIKKGWVDYIVGVRRKLNENPKKKLKDMLKECLHKGISAARSWTNQRWKLGYFQVFDPSRADEILDTGSDDSDDSSE